MLLPLRCCPACVSSGPSRLSPVLRRRIPRTLYQHDLTTQTRFKASDARRHRRAATKPDNEGNTSSPSNSTSNGSYVQKNGSSSGVPSRNRTFVSVRETEDVPLSYRAIDGLSKSRGRLAGNNRSSSSSTHSSTTEDQANNSARIPRTRSTSDPSSSSNDNPSDSSQTPLKSKLFKWLKWPVSNSSSSSTSQAESSPEQHSSTTSSSTPQVQTGSNKVFQELLQGALLSSNSINSNSGSNPVGAQARNTRNTRSDKAMLEPGLEVEPEVVVDRELRELGEGEVEVDETERVRQMDLLQGQSRGHGMAGSCSGCLFPLRVELTLIRILHTFRITFIYHTAVPKSETRPKPLTQRSQRSTREKPGSNRINSKRPSRRVG